MPDACRRKNARQLRQGAPRRGPKARLCEQAANRARREGDAELQQLARDPLVSPARVLPRKPKHRLLLFGVERRAARPSGGLGPPAPHQLAMPAQQRLRCQREPVPPPIGKQTRERGDESTIGGLELRALASPAQHRELMAQDNQLEVLVELAAAATPDEQRRMAPKAE